ncbi:B3 domain-containing protein Os03g0619600-like [Papaver somniferum]|uniref:B3 domain-containing protein Os03g0619600-like n=1 Tax=Papaver somniferum TaxID=3469 RepID=UPI000E701210|nr:B3 domain-containing protein Os03g0619600-like [Papaver somniferum]
MQNKIAELAAEEEQNRRLRIPCENSTIKKESSSTQEKFAAAGAVPREVRSFSSPFPFFWTSMNPTGVGARFRMTIPLQFARDHLLAEVTNADRELNVLLQNEEGLSWEVLVRANGHSYTFYTGWKDFATENKLEIGDCMIFELIDRLPDSTFAMSFHICRNPVPVPSLPAQKSNVPEKECFTHLPSSRLAREIKRRGRAYENLMIREGGSDNHGVCFSNSCPDES